MKWTCASHASTYPDDGLRALRDCQTIGALHTFSTHPMSFSPSRQCGSRPAEIIIVAQLLRWTRQPRGDANRDRLTQWMLRVRAHTPHHVTLS